VSWRFNPAILALPASLRTLQAGALVLLIEGHCELAEDLCALNG
jgi:hypothetical protein